MAGALACRRHQLKFVMHEMSIAMSLLEMALEEANAAGCRRIISLTVNYGQIAGIMPEALDMAFGMLTSDTPHAGAKLILNKVPLRLRCLFCQCEFSSPESANALAPCPNCGEILGHQVLQGKELVLARMEAIP